MMSIDEFVLSLFNAGITVSKTTYADKPAVDVKTGVSYHNITVCFLNETTVLVKHKEIPGRDYIINGSLLSDFYSNEYSILDTVNRCPEFDTFYDAIEKESGFL